jgi:hypothetical protein
MQARYDQANCFAQFAISHANSIMAADSNLSGALDGEIATVNADMAALLADVAPDKNSEFKAQLSTAQTDIRALNSAARDQLRNLFGPSKREARAQVRAAYQEAMAQYVDCRKSANMGFARARVNAYNTILDHDMDTIAKLAAKGLDTTAMTQLVSDAREKVVAPIQAAIDSGDYNAAKDVVKGYCLYNGCSTLNFHFAAKMGIAKLDAVIAKANDSNLSDAQKSLLSQATTSLEAARTALAAVGDGAYTDDNKKGVWDNLKAASSSLAQLLNSGKKASTGAKDNNKGGASQ